MSLLVVWQLHLLKVRQQVGFALLVWRQHPARPESVAAPDDDVITAGTAVGGAVPSSARATAGNISETISVMSAIKVNNRKFLLLFIHFSIQNYDNYKLHF